LSLPLIRLLLILLILLPQTAILGIIIIWIFSVLIFFYFPEDLDGHQCNTLASCFATTLNAGMRNGGGIADVMEEHFPFEPNGLGMWGVRSVFDLAFFLIVIIVLLNIIFGE
jgi:hypothetical protein